MSSTARVLVIIVFKSYGYFGGIRQNASSHCSRVSIAVYLAIVIISVSPVQYDGAALF